MELDPERLETWEGLKKVSHSARKSWIHKNMPVLLKTLESYRFSTFSPPPWDVIGFICLNDNLYKEAEHIYDTMIKRTKGKENFMNRLTYYRGIAKFLQGRHKEAYEDFKLARHYELLQKDFHGPSLKAMAYMEKTIFPMREMVTKSQDKLRHDLNVPRFVDKVIGPDILKTLHKLGSASPLFSTNISQGGGYLLTLKNPLGIVKSIAIDPGFDFLDIFRDLGLSIVDLDAILATHDHDDHTESIEGLLSLLAKYNDHSPQSRVKRLDVFGSPGVMLKYKGLFNATDPYGNKEVNFKLLIPGSTIDSLGETSLKEEYGCALHVTQAYHEELWTHQESGVGVIIETNLSDKNHHPLKIGITGDTRYEAGLGTQYHDCQIILLNIGSLEKEEGKLLEQHLGLCGSINLLKEARPHIAVLTEFGEEFRGKRSTVASVIEDWSQPMEGPAEFKVIPADIHLEIRLTDLNIKETDTNVFLPYTMIEVDETEPEVIRYKLKEKTR